MVKDMALESKCAAVRRGKESPVNVGGQRFATGCKWAGKAQRDPRKCTNAAQTQFFKRVREVQKLCHYWYLARLRLGELRRQRTAAPQPYRDNKLRA
jgi:hypothetical protein